MAAVAVPLLMVGVAALSTWRHHTVDQTSWRGASLGMFARIDAPPNRLVRGVVDETGGQSSLQVPPADLARARMRALVTPTDRNLEDLAESWAPRVDGRLVRIEVWATRFRTDGPAVRLELLASFDLAADDGPDGSP